jgi:hypothetical protein
LGAEAGKAELADSKDWCESVGDVFNGFGEELEFAKGGVARAVRGEDALERCLGRSIAIFVRGVFISCRLDGGASSSGLDFRGLL